MTHTENFIRLALEGGWIPKELLMASTVKEATEIKTYFRKDTERFGINYIINGNVLGAEVKPSAIDKNVALLDPLAWQAVGKVKGWQVRSDWIKDKNDLPDNFEGIIHAFAAEWRFAMLHFTDLLADGKSIEEAIREILK